MDVSLDTDIIIHLYKAGMKETLFCYFDKVYIHEYLLESELKNKSLDVYNDFLKDIAQGKITVVNKTYLAGIKMLKSFEDKLYDIKTLFDFGEANAIALAATLGIAALITDDTKKYGPHEALINEYIEDVIPFAFYELLFLKYIESIIEVNQLKEQFDKVNNISFEKPMDFIGRISRVVRRFSTKGTDRDRLWINNFCSQRSINYPDKMKSLRTFLETIESS